MSDIINFPKTKKQEPSRMMFELTVYKNSDEEFEVYLEMNDQFTDEEVFEGMIQAAMKFAMDNNVLEESEDEYEFSDRTDNPIH